MSTYATRLKTRGAPVGVCNICGTTARLTEDHVPPRGALRVPRVALKHLVERLSVEHPPSAERIAQDGLKYRTLCPRCNNDLLGHRYDPTLVRLSRDVGVIAESSLRLPSTMTVTTHPNRLARSVAGHLIAVGVGNHRQGQALSALTDFLLDEQFRFPANLRLYYWLYPYPEQVVIRDAGRSMRFFSDFAPFLLMKFFPVAFMIVVDEPTHWQLPVRRLDSLLSSDIDQPHELTIDLAGVPHPRWPEAPDDNGVVLFGESATSALPRPLLPRSR